MNKIILYASCVSAVMADMLLVWWAKTSSHPIWSMIIGIILTLTSLVIWSYSMRKGIESSMAITTYALFTVAGCSSLGYFVFHESLSITNIIGIFLAIIALIMISL